MSQQHNTSAAVSTPCVYLYSMYFSSNVGAKYKSIKAQYVEAVNVIWTQTFISCFFCSRKSVFCLLLDTETTN